MDLEHKVALVTGAGQGIGKGCAIQLAKQGADLIINDRPGSPTVQQTALEIQELGRQCTVLEADVFSRESSLQLVADAIAWKSQIDILVSNPALTHHADFLEFDIDRFEQIIQSTLVSGFVMSQQIAKQMVKQQTGGKIIFISSVHAEMPVARSIAYGAAKAGLNHMAETMAVELARHHINVNVIEPGWIDTPGERTLFTEEYIQEQAGKLPLGRLGTPDDIGSTVAFLASSSADYITGAILRVDGGFVHKHCRAEKS